MSTLRFLFIQYSLYLITMYINNPKETQYTEDEEILLLPE